MSRFRRLRLLLLVLTLDGILVCVPSDANASKESPERIVYERAPDEHAPWPTRDVYSVNPDGTGDKALTNDGHSHTPAWSPDGQQILFIRDSYLQTKPPYRESQRMASYHPVELWLMDRDGRNPHLLRRLEGVIYSASWRP